MFGFFGLFLRGWREKLVGFVRVFLVLREEGFKILLTDGEIKIKISFVQSII